MAQSQDIEKLYKHIYQLIATKPVQMIDTDNVVRGDTVYRFYGRNYKSGTRQKELEDFQSHSEKLSILNPILVVDIIGVRALASGQKRLEAAKELGQKKIYSKVLDYDECFPEDLESLTDDEKPLLLREILTSIVYNESAQTSKIDDEHTLHLMRMVASNHGIGRGQFKDVKWIFGVKEDESQYRSLLRLWKIATCPGACKLIDDKFVRIGLFKADANMRPMCLSKKADLIVRGITSYVENLRLYIDRDMQSKAPTEWKGKYKESEIVSIIRKVDYYNVTALTKQTDNLRFSPYKLSIDNGLMNIPAEKVDFRSPKDTDFKKALDIYWKLKHAAHSLENYIITSRPIEPGGPLRQSDHFPGPISYEEDYSKFIVDNHLEAFCNIDAMEKIVFAWDKSTGAGTKKAADVFVTEEIRKYPKKSDRQKAKFAALIERSNKERASKATADQDKSQVDRKDEVGAAS